VMRHERLSHQVGVVTDAIRYEPHPYPDEPALKDRLDTFEDGLFGDLKAKIRSDRTAAAISCWDVDSWELAVDADVVATFTFKVADGEGPYKATGLLQDFSDMVVSAQVVGIEAPPANPAAWYAISRSDPYIVIVRDLSGFGQLAKSTEYDLGRPLGQWMKAMHQRSGIPQVNEQRRRAIARMYRAPGGREAALRVVDAVQVWVINMGYETLHPSLWTVWKNGEPFAHSSAAPAKFSFPDQILKELNLAAYPKRARGDDALARSSVAALASPDDGTPWASPLITTRVEPQPASRHAGRCLSCDRDAPAINEDRLCLSCWESNKRAAEVRAERDPDPVFDPVNRKPEDYELKPRPDRPIVKPTERDAIRLVDGYAAEERLVIQLRAEGLTQAQVARRMGIPQTRVSRIETNLKSSE
jgi:Sigma-70, region 4